ncbi:hypothetical protein [Stenotrophomonas sp. YIM B06876]|uniref:hypothetical protein n=1 Tax=Stenotrophomonas sp. YIM B06876 TaxID=3060211 RepID=UPI0027399D40|nr:hypothetical protein [Stenotrophomonas sp. YIM B06876]
MYTRTALITALLAITPVAYASESTRSIEQLAQESGLTYDDICMLLGPSSTHLQYLTSYDRVQRKFIDTVGYAEYERLINHDFPAAPLHHRHLRNQTAAL